MMLTSSQPFADLPQPAGNECKGQLKGVTVKFTPTGKGAYRIDNIPSACMTLSNVLIDDNPNKAVPTPLGKYTFFFQDSGQVN